MSGYVKNIYDVLNEVFREGAFSQLRLNEELKKSPANSSLITKVVYGVLDKSLYLDYFISCVVQKKPKPNICLILKIGIYMLKFLSLPAYAIVNNLVDFTKEIGKKQLAGFVNATLKLSIGYELQLPSDVVVSLSLESGYPQWLVKCLFSQYGEKLTREMLLFRLSDDTHIRRSGCVSAKNFEDILNKEKIEYRKSCLDNGYYVTHSTIKKTSLPRKYYANQSISSILVCEAVNPSKKDSVLDACAAPGGKSAYLAEICSDGVVVACDLHAHRTLLIEKYAQRLLLDNIDARTMDSTLYCAEFEKRFNVVLLDVPCSGFGVAQSKPDIKINKTYDDVISISATQRAILENASNYVKSGGTLVYSTCTMLRQENQDVVDGFLFKHKDFFSVPVELPIKPKLTIGNYVQLLPNLDGVEGFFVAKMRRR